MMLGWGGAVLLVMHTSKRTGRGDSTSIVSPMFKFKEVHFQGFLHSTSLHTIVSESSYTDLGYFRSFIGIFDLTFDASSSSARVYLEL